VVNNGNADLAKIMPIAKGGGLSGLGGCQDPAQSSPTTRARRRPARTRRCADLGREGAALIGAYQSGSPSPPAPSPSAHGVPSVTAESGRRQPHRARLQVGSSATTPVAIDFARAYSTFLREQKAAGQKVGSIALVHENTEYGNSVASVIAEQFAKDGLTVTQKIAYSANSSDVQPQVLQLKEKNPDVAIFISYTSDAILYTKTMKEVNWKPAIMIADNAGFNDPAFVKSLGASVEGL
jgi:branched-chain amino acid transport system substrate-binding protein